MLDLLTLCLFTVFLIHFYMIKYKEFKPWYKLNNNEAIISDFNHVYTPSDSKIFDSDIDTAHVMKKNHIIEIINYGEDECYLDVFDDQKRIIYHFFCPKYLLFSDQYNHTHYLESDKKYSFFLTTISPENFITFRQSTFDRIKAPPYLSKENALVHYQSDDNLYIDKVIKELKNNNYQIQNIDKIKGENIWPHGGTVYKHHMILNKGERILIVGTIKDSTQSLEILTDEDKYFFPIKGEKIYTHWLINTEPENIQVLIIERNINLFSSKGGELIIIRVI